VHDEINWVRLSSPVLAIEDRDKAVRVSTETLSIEAAAVIVAIPPALAGRLSYDPPYPVCGISSRSARLKEA
jgi:monoamine oxidase